jgi:hypothetical protein
VTALEDRHSTGLAATLAAGVLALTAVLVGWHGVDLPAQIYRVGLFHRSGLTLWDSQWYSGHWTLGYSVLYPPVAGLIGVQATEVASAAAAAWAFDRLVVGHFGRAGRAGSLLFAVDTLAQIAIGQLPFLLAEAFAMGALWAASRRRWPLALVLAAATSLASPLAGAFLGLAALAWLHASWPDRRLPLMAMGAAAGVPVVILEVLFPGQGAMPFPAASFFWLLFLCVSVLVLLPRRQRALRIGGVLYVVAVAASFAFTTAMGANVGRLNACVGGPLVLCVLVRDRRRLLAVMMLPLVLWEWTPAIATFSTNRLDPSTKAAYFAPVLSFVSGHNNPPGRIEIVPTQLHWEAAYVAPLAPLARGWERQLDTADNPIFYDSGALNALTYRAWLLDSGVRYVALPDVALDYAAVVEARLIAASVPGLVLVRQSAHWRIFEVDGSPGLVSGPAQLVRLEGGHVDLGATGAGTVVLRVRNSPRWTVVSGPGCVVDEAGPSTLVDTSGPGEVILELRLVPGTHGRC